jgi:hypothetical protein
MANYVENDRGEMVVAVGAPGSLERVKVEWPSLIERLDNLWCNAQAYKSPGDRVDEALEMMLAAGITSPIEKCSLLEASLYRHAGPGSVTALVKSHLVV